MLEFLEKDLDVNPKQVCASKIKIILAFRTIPFMIVCRFGYTVFVHKLMGGRVIVFMIMIYMDMQEKRSASESL